MSNYNYLLFASEYQREISSIFLNVLGNDESLKKNFRDSVVWKEYLQWMQESAIEDNEKSDNALRREIKKLVYKDLTISELETNLSSAIQYQREISAIFTSAIDAAESLGEKYGKSASLVTGCLQNKHENVIKATDEKSTHPLREQIKELAHIQNSIKTRQHFLKEIVYRIKSIDENLYSKIKNIRYFDSLEYPKKIDTYNDCLQSFDELIYLIWALAKHVLDKSYKLGSLSDILLPVDIIMSGFGYLAIIALIFLLFIFRDILITLLVVIGLIVFGYTLLISHLHSKEKLLGSLRDDLMDSVKLPYLKKK